MRLGPAAPGTGIVFAPGTRADVSNARAGDHCTVLGRGAGRVRAVEHLLAACTGLGITDLLVDCPNGEPPFGDGSSRHFVRALTRSGMYDSGTGPRPLVLSRPVLVESGGSFAVARPASALRVLCVTDFPWSGPECCDWQASSATFASELAEARTVAYTGESPARLRQALGLRFRLVRRGGFVLPARPRFAGEACRHKLLDLLGDLALVARPLRAEVYVFRPGHRLNLALARELATQAA